MIVAENLPKTARDVLHLIIPHINENVDKKIQTSIFCRSWENHVSPQMFQTYRHKDRWTYEQIDILK